VTRAVSDITEGRAPIEHLLGILMLIYRIDPDAAFGVLRWRSQVTNVELCHLAQQLLADIRGLEYDNQVPRRETFDRLLMTVHERVSAD
jgi:ANTAR domain